VEPRSRRAACKIAPGCATAVASKASGAFP
jgi:hypothetical protein